MTQSTKRVAAIHDLSGFGRCSLAVIIPILSIMKTQVCSIPTTILSSHTGGLGNIAVRDLSGYVKEAQLHYERLQLEFDAIYTGYLGDVQHYIDTYEFLKASKRGIKIVDPVMGDHGKPYRMVTLERIQKMIELVKEADVITPNMTEVYLLLEEEYQHTSLQMTEYQNLLLRLASLGPKQVVITGAHVVDGSIANIGYDSVKEMFYVIPCYYSNVSYPGTGDIFASILTGGLLNQESLPCAIEKATRFLEYVIKKTLQTNSDTRFGVNLEQHLSWLIEPRLTYKYQEIRNNATIALHKRV